MDNDNEFADLERELKSLRPRRVSTQVTARLSKQLVAVSPARFTTATSWNSWKWANWSVAAGLALVVAAVSTWERRFASSTAAPEHADYKPVSAEKLVLESSDEGLVTLDDGTTGRRVHTRSLETITWKNPATNASLTWTVPREEVRVVPVRFY